MDFTLCLKNEEQKNKASGPRNGLLNLEVCHIYMATMHQLDNQHKRSLRHIQRDITTYKNQPLNKHQSMYFSFNTTCE